MPFRIALSGLNAATSDLEVTGNNIANASTNGFKLSRAEFGSLYASSIQDTSTKAGQGAQVTRIAQQFSQGSVDFTSNNLDLAISGQGFFVLEKPDGTAGYTRAGAYSVDRDGYVINQGNDRLQVYGAVTGASGITTFNTGVLQDLQLPTVPSTPTATTTINASLNLNSSEVVPSVAFDTTLSVPRPDSYNNATSTTVYDALGNAHTTTLYFVKTAVPNEWEAYSYVDGTVAGGVQPMNVTFDPATGALNAATTFAFNFTPPGGSPQSVNLDFAGTTQYGSPFGVNNLSQDGYTSGRLAGVDIDAEGVVFARYSNGKSSALAKVALAKFNNNQGLGEIGDTAWGETFASGAAQMGEAATSSFGHIQSGALEGSNVDVAEQLVNLITAQRNFQANAQVIQTADQITQSIINLR